MTTTRGYPMFQCEVCGSFTRFHHLDAKLCSACSSFYRRAVRENLKYRCDFNQKCQTGKGRYACRACRFAKCQELGARLPSTSNPSPPAINLPTIKKSQIKDAYPILNKLVTGYDLYIDNQRLILHSYYPELRLNNSKIITNRKTEKTEIGAKCVPPQMYMFNRYYGPFQNLKATQKKHILTEVMGEIEMFNIMYLTVSYFPDLNDSRFMDTCHTYFDSNPDFIPYYYDGFIKPDELEVYLKFLEYPMKKMRDHIGKFKRVGLRKVDMLALMFMSLYKKADQENMITPEMNEYRESMLAEWASDLCRHYGAIEGPKQMTNLMYLFFESDTISVKLKKYVLASQVQLNKSKEELMCGLEDYLKQLDLGECD